MKYIIMVNGSQRDFDAPPSEEDMAAIGSFLKKFNQDLKESGEFVDARGLAAPVHTRRLQLQNGVPVVTDGPYPETLEVLAGYTIVECDSFDRATEIAARISNCPPGPGGAEGLFLDVRPIVDGRDDLEL